VINWTIAVYFVRFLTDYPLIRNYQAASVGFFIAITTVITGCSDSSNTTDPDSLDSTGVPLDPFVEQTDSPGGLVDDGSAPGVPVPEAVDPAVPLSDAEDEPGATDEPTADEPGDADETAADEPGDADETAADEPGDADDTDESAADEPADSGTVATPSAPGADLSGGEDDSPTATESLSLQGPFVRDTSRGAGPPSAPTGLTLLLSAENWLEFTWTPSSDDQSVEAYEIYRDGQLVQTIRGDSGYEFDYRSWISTSFIDCNYTRYTLCEDSRPLPGGNHEYTVVAVDNEGMSSPHSQSASFQLESLQSSPVDLAGYTVVFDEQFTDAELSRERWKTSLAWGPDTTVNGELQYFVNIFGNNPPAYDPFVLTGDTVKITGIATPPEMLEAANGQPYLSGVLTTSDHFAMTYGYVEMSAKLAGGEGLLSTFYLFNQDYEKNKPEIDIVEYISARPDKSYQTYHYYDSNRVRSFSGEKHSSPTMETMTNIDLSAGFHTYGVLWEPGLVVWYIDGAEVRRISGARVSDEPMNIIAHMVVGSDWIGAPDAASIPATFEIDYIRAWQK
jgi:hypothetical protein